VGHLVCVVVRGRAGTCGVSREQPAPGWDERSRSHSGRCFLLALRCCVSWWLWFPPWFNKLNFYLCRTALHLGRDYAGVNPWSDESFMSLWVRAQRSARPRSLQGLCTVRWSGHRTRACCFRFYFRDLLVMKIHSFILC